MKIRYIIPIAIFIFSILQPVPAKADGIIIPEPPVCDPGPCPGPVPLAQMDIRYHHVTVSIKNQIAVTHVDQVFFNPNDWAVEGEYLFPLPKDAVVSSFTLWVDGKPVKGEILDAKQARQTYEQIVSSLRDPALLEYAGQGAVRASIFPIPPQGERRIELEYTQALAAENGLVRYVYPLSTEKFSAQPLEDVRISVEIESAVPVRAVYSPSHAVDIERLDDRHIRAGYEQSDVLPDADFALFYSIGENQAFHILTYRDPGDPTDPDGFFLLLLAPSIDAGTQAIPKDVILVLDRSGSMEGEKFRQAQDALRYILGHLNPEDRFNVIAFSTGLETFDSSLRPTVEAEKAMDWVNSLSAQGSTDINRALLEAAGLVPEGVASERPTYLIFLTDGLPTEGVVDSQQILDNFAGSAPPSLRLFVFGVGYDVDTFLLDSLAQAHHGNTTYVLPEERLDEVLSGFYARISTPVLTDLSLDFGELVTSDLYPDPIPDLFRGSQIILVGRYRQGGVAQVSLTGLVNGERKVFEFPDQVFAADSASSSPGAEASIPRLWATRKIGYLLNQIRLHGADQETIDQVVRLSVRYGIVTPYTSYLVTEEAPLGAAEQSRIAAQQYNQLQAAATAPASGQQAVQKAADLGSLAGAAAPEALTSQEASQVKIVGARTFVNREGVWLDTAYDPDTMQTVKVAFLSHDYFSLVEQQPALAAAFALGERVVAVSDGAVYEVVSQGSPSDPLPTSLPATAVHPTPAALQARTAVPADKSQPVSGGLPCASGIAAFFLLLPLLVLRRRR